MHSMRTALMFTWGFCGGVGRMRTIGIAKESVAATDDAGVDSLHHEWHRPCARQLVIGRAPVVTLVRPPANIQAHTQTASPGGLAMNALTMSGSSTRQVTCLAPRDLSTHFYRHKQGEVQTIEAAPVGFGGVQAVGVC